MSLYHFRYFLSTLRILYWVPTYWVGTRLISFNQVNQLNFKGVKTLGIGFYICNIRSQYLGGHELTSDMLCMHTFEICCACLGPMCIGAQDVHVHRSDLFFSCGPIFVCSSLINSWTLFQNASFMLLQFFLTHTPGVTQHKNFNRHNNNLTEANPTQST